MSLIVYLVEIYTLIMKTLIKSGLLLMVFIVSSNVLYAQLFDKNIVTPRQELKAELNRLWVDNAVYTRLSILCLTDRLPGTEETLARLMQNQEDMGVSFSTYYGRDKGDEFCQLIASNTSLIVRIIRSKNTGSTQDLEDAQKRLASNYNDILNYLVKVNPYLKRKELEAKLTSIVLLTNKQIDLRLSTDYDLDIQNFDQLLTESIEFSNILSEGIIKQFPKRFK
jgi:hypothetical protein